MISSFLSAQSLKLEDITSGKYQAKVIRNVRAMADGETYAQLSEDRKKIERRSFKSGSLVETLFDVATARDVKLASISGYILSPDEKNILIETERTPIYRHSVLATYYI